MGGSAGGGNAQLFQLMSQYGGGEGGAAAAPQKSTKQRFQGAMDAWMNSGGKGVFAPWSAIDGRSLGGNGGGGGGGGGKPPATEPPIPPTDAEKFAWQFPEYTQTWAFTPPTPTPYEYPQPFDTKKYGNPYNKKDVKKNR